MALSSGKKIEHGAGGGLLNLAVAALAVCFSGGMAMVTAAGVRPARSGQGIDDEAKATDAAASRVVGLFAGSVTGGAAAGDVRADILSERGFKVKNSAGADEITEADVGSCCFVVDDETVARGSADATRPPAGVVRELDADGVIVEISPAIAAAAAIAA